MSTDLATRHANDAAAESVRLDLPHVNNWSMAVENLISDKDIESRLPTQQHLRRSGLGMRGIILPMDVGSRLDPITVGTSRGRAS